MGTLEIRSICKSFGTFSALQDVSLSIPDGEFFSLLGPSGCGKSTLLRVLAGFETPDSGSVWREGVRLDQLPPHRREFNLVFQRYALFPHLNVQRNIEFGLRMKRVPIVEMKARVEEILNLVKLEGFVNRDVATLSGGQQQRVALARALVNRPQVLLLDEPLSALDLKLRQEMQIELRSLQKKLGCTFVFVTHDQDEALTLSDRIAVMHRGVIMQVGTPTQIYNEPSNAFVAQFIGTMSLLKEDWMIRPEKLSLSREKPAGAAIVVEGTVQERFFQGAVSQLLIDHAGKAPLVVMRSSSEDLPSPGDRVFVWGQESDCIRFPEEALK